MAEYIFGVGERPQAPVLKQNGFELCDNNFTIPGFPRVEGKRLRELFNPSIRKTGQIKAQKEAEKLFKKPFYAAQLKYYDIKFKSSSKAEDLRNLLEESARQGKCDRLPESTANIQRQMLNDYISMRQKWENDIRAWEGKKRQYEIDQAAREKEWKENYWNQCTTPQQRANCDFDRFLNHHYLTDGKPDPTKTPEVVVYGDEMFWRRFGKAVPGLHVLRFPTSPYRYGVCAGWDRSEVLRVAREEIRKAQEQQKQEDAEKQRWLDAEWEETSQPHRQYLQRSAKGKEPPELFELQRCTGSYIIRCDNISGEYEVREGLTMDIRPGVDDTLIAHYHLWLVEGVMLLGLSEDKLDHLAVDLDSKFDPGEEEEEEEEMYGYGDCADEHDQYDGQPNTAGKRAALAMLEAQAERRKKPKTTEPVPRRVYFRSRYHDTSKGYITPTVEFGHLDFVDNTCTKFAGLFYDSSQFGENIRFEGYKVADEPNEGKSNEWHHYSERRSYRKMWDW